LKNILILYPHFPPSNLAGVHRARLFAQHLPAFGWNPVIVTVHEKYYEERLDYNLEKLLPPDLRIEKVNAFSTGKFRLIGDIGLRAFFHLYKKARQLIQAEKIEFLYIPIPSFYCALLGRWLHHSTGVKYGIDYIDPWVHEFPGSDKIFSRHWFSTKLAKLLEPVAVKKASLITGVAAGYYRGVQERNPALHASCIFGAMPYGGEAQDHKILQDLQLKPYLFQKTNKLQLVYAGAMLPKAFAPLVAIFKAIAADKALFSEIEFHFIGTGKTPNDPVGFHIKSMAEDYGLWNTIVFEYPQRIPYLDVLIHLEIADGIFILGSTEPHYTPSKVYQGILSGKPILAVLHNQSTAVTFLQQSGGGLVLPFDGEHHLDTIETDFPFLILQYIEWIKNFNSASIQQEIFESYSAKNITKQLASLLNQVVS
jgi:hypothetical protein